MRVRHGKFKGKTFRWMFERQRGYIKWLCEQPAGKMVRFFDLIEYALDHDAYAFSD
jgi:hypothetical protein